ncbi:MAG: nucleotidyl transferase AbiEii/AbiGii toxin family protein [Acidobacteria bacterium]|nr:nucleotidyl transferase AbiEii/AbiGii toxin family protein [Acidobacteriota bacterium]
MDSHLYLERLYPFQDKVLGVLAPLGTGFYLTGGTCLSRAYLGHRFSDDLDFFVNHRPEFGLWRDQAIHALAADARWSCEVLSREERFARLILRDGETALRIEWVNDVPCRIGTPREHPALGRIDSPENILSNKVTALVDREEPKDLVDIWGLCTTLGLSLSRAVSDAAGKAAGVFPPDVARRLASATEEDWKLVKWIAPPDPARFLSDLQSLAEQLLSETASREGG